MRLVPFELPGCELTFALCFCHPLLTFPHTPAHDRFIPTTAWTLSDQPSWSIQRRSFDDRTSGTCQILPDVFAITSATAKTWHCSHARNAASTSTAPSAARKRYGLHTSLSAFSMTRSLSTLSSAWTQTTPTITEIRRHHELWTDLTSTFKKKVAPDLCEPFRPSS